MNIKTNNALKMEVALVRLYNVLDPEIGLNIVDLGLVYQIDFNDEEKEIVVTMTLTTQFCPMGESIVDTTKQAMKHAFHEYTIHVNLVFEPAWNVSMITEEGNKFLN